MNELVQISRISNFKDFKLKFEIRDLESLKFEILEIIFRQKKVCEQSSQTNQHLLTPKKLYHEYKTLYVEDDVISN
jgi:hypothetical protein